MLKQIPKLLLLLALLTGFVVSSAPVFGRGAESQGGCKFDYTTYQCVKYGGCTGLCSQGARLGSCVCFKGHFPARSSVPGKR
jgi:hypothetical protein